MGRYAVTAKLRRPELDRYFDPLKAVCGKQQGERVGDDGGLDAQVMREGLFRVFLRGICSQMRQEDCSHKAEAMAQSLGG